jgi:hypothetical protein
LIFRPDFFKALSTEYKALECKSVVCPDILTIDNEHQNPHVIRGIGRFREIIWDIYFSSFILSRIIAYINRLMGDFTKRNDHVKYLDEGNIYQGYGACYLLMPRFLKKYRRLWSPGFVMGEEFYLSRQLEECGESMYYMPRIQVLHHDHATVSKLPSRKLWEMTKHYHSIYRFFISPYRLKMDNGKKASDFDRML